MRYIGFNVNKYRFWAGLSIIFLVIDVVLIGLYFTSKKQQVDVSQQSLLGLEELGEKPVPKEKRTLARKTGEKKIIDEGKEVIFEPLDETLGFFNNNPDEWSALGRVVGLNKKEMVIEVSYHSQPADCVPKTDIDSVRTGDGLLCGVGKYKIKKVNMRSAVCSINSKEDCPLWEVGVDQIELGDFVYIIGSPEQVVNTNGGEIEVHINQ